jgi:glucose/arabinose dehydrogenase
MGSISRKTVLAAAIACGIAPAHAAVCDGIATSGNGSLTSVPVATGLVHRPLFVTAPPGDRTRIFIVEQDGYIQIKKRGDAPTLTRQFLDIHTKVEIADGEQGLLGLAFDPDYASTGQFYVSYTEIGTGSITVERYTVSANPDVADARSNERILRFTHPQQNHNSGQLEFGPDGYLYVWSGDGGGSHDSGTGHGVCGNGQSMTTLLGKLLRIDVRGIAPTSRPEDCGGGGHYRIPADNPFDDGPGGTCDEIFALGLRNAWRNSFDPATGDLYVADVGQSCTEEINVVHLPGNGGQNFGWRSMEGTHCFDPLNPHDCFNDQPAPCELPDVPPCGDPSLFAPILTYDHGDLGECAVTGGYVYRGCKMSGFLGTYFYGDYCAGFVKSFHLLDGLPANRLDWTAQLDPGGTLPYGLGSFGVDAEGEIHIVSLYGDVLKIVPPLPSLEVSAPGAADQLLLSKTGDWTWQDLHYETDHPVSGYRVYRGKPNGRFACIHKATEPRWSGDTKRPAQGQLIGYIVTAVNESGEETLPGAAGTFDPSGCP